MTIPSSGGRTVRFTGISLDEGADSYFGFVMKNTLFVMKIPPPMNFFDRFVMNFYFCL